MNKPKLTGRQRRKIERKDPLKRMGRMVTRLKRSRKTLVKFLDDHRDMTDAEIKEMALAIYRGQIFTSWQLPDGNDLQTHFMPILFMTQAQRIEVAAMDPGVIVADMSAELESSINGYPVFSQARFLSRGDSDRLLAAYREIEAKIDQIQGERNG